MKKKIKPLSAKQFFEWEVANGLTQDNPAYKNMHYGLAKKLFNEYGRPDTILEIGPGPGALLEGFINEGVLMPFGFDMNVYEQRHFVNRNPDYEKYYVVAKLHEIRKIWPQILEPTFSFIPLVVSIEVFEHIPDEEIRPALQFIAKNCQYFYFSSTPHTHENPDFDIQWGHINVKPQADWIKLFAECGFVLHKMENTPTPWAMVFKSNFYP